MTKKGYQKRLPTVLPPAPRSAPEQKEAWLDTEAPIPEAARTSRPRKITGGLLLGLVVLVAHLVLQSAYLLGAFDDDAEPGTADRAPVEDVGGSSFEESLVAATVQPDGDIVVRQRILSEEPLRRLVLALPDLPDLPDALLSATGVRVLADGGRATGATEISSGSASYRLGGATEVQVHYRMRGAIQRSGSAPGRALAVVTSMDVTYSPRPAREILVVRAPEVLSLACAASTGAPLVPCGSALDGNLWQVELPSDRAGGRVIAQITLP